MDKQQSEKPNVQLPDFTNEAIYIGREPISGVCIDTDDGKIREDAVLVERTATGYIIHVSMLDVASFIPFDESFLDYFNRGYDFTSSGAKKAFSIKEGERRPTVTISIPISDTMEIGSPVVRRTYLTNPHILNLTETNKVFAAGNDTELTHQVEQILFLGIRLGQSRPELASLSKEVLRTSVLPDIFALRLFLEKNPHIYKSLSDSALRQILTIANEKIAEVFFQAGLYAMYRNSDSLFHLIDKGIVPESQNTAILDELSYQINEDILIAYYSPSPEGHKELGGNCYLRVTSPLRSVEDFINQQILLAFMNNTTLPFSFDDLSRYCEIKNRKIPEFKIPKEIKKLERIDRAKSLRLQSLLIPEEKKKAVVTAEVNGRLRYIDRTDILAYDMLMLIAYVVMFPANITKKTADLVISAIREGIAPFDAYDIYALLLAKNQQPNQMPQIKAAAFDFLMQHPQCISKFFPTLHNVFGWDLPQIDETNCFTLTLQGREYKSIPFIQDDIQSTYRAELSLIQQIAQNTNNIKFG